jgi:hypothetical protein
VRDVEVTVGEKDGTLSFFVNFENSGTTATRHLAIASLCGEKPINFYGDLERTQPYFPAVIGPRSNLRHFTCVAQGEYALLLTRYLVFGKIEYGDVFGGKQHKTEYCWELISLPNSGGHVSMRQCTYKEDAVHNCQDEDCAVR